MQMQIEFMFTIAKVTRKSDKGSKNGENKSLIGLILAKSIYKNSEYKILSNNESFLTCPTPRTYECKLCKLRNDPISITHIKIKLGWSQIHA